MVTMADVARRANVSLSTVSYALNSTRPVAVDTRERVFSAMAELGYHRNAAARSLAARKSHVVALIFPAVEIGIGSTIGEFVASAAATARERGYHLVLWPLRADESADMVELARQGQADGVLLMEVTLDDARVAALRSAGIPVTLIGRTREPEGVSYVDIDFERTAAEAVAHLAGLGHEHIGFVNHSVRTQEAGYGPTVRMSADLASSAAAHGVRLVQTLCEETPVAGRAAVHELLAADGELTAIITMNEMATFGVTAELAQLGRRIPEDVSVLAVVTSPGMGASTMPPLTVLLSPGAELGRLGTLSLIDQIEATVPVPRPVLVPCGLAAGGSTAPVRPH